jgi:hypothetical protein
MAIVAFSPISVKQTTMSDHDQPMAVNLLNQAFVAEAPNLRHSRSLLAFHRRLGGQCGE